MEQAACRGKGPDIFFPERGESQRPGKEVCMSCTVTRECSEYQQRTNSNHGMWAGRMIQRHR